MVATLKMRKSAKNGPSRARIMESHRRARELKTFDILFVPGITFNILGSLSTAEFLLDLSPKRKRGRARGR